MKMMEVTEKRIGDSTFYIRPFPAFYAANMSGELIALITPVLSALIPLLGSVGGEPFDIANWELDKAGPALTEAVAGLNGDKVEGMMRKLLITQNNVSVACAATNLEAKPLTTDLANEVFCGSYQDMYVLCWEVIKLNYGGFFRKLGAQSGSLQTALQQMAPNTSASGSLTKGVSQTLS